ncbi:ABC transporter substrate-binding protein [Alkalicoccobacillus gibsonii]|uniref:ABC transporter substrate-binding protein n=1 Tax=Alkalicoccobacillus gibsonii TaxID=79881 RepID=UPI001932C4EC|nr:extracellular solute-binding protein [Alkalicoccobacillus gibsonii]MBM0064838.1 extracellular solute-binding protein [Alkalicoccobacillus gibsonii]
MRLKWPLSAAVVLVLTAGCSVNENTNETEEASGEITVWAWNLEADYLIDLVPEFEKLYPDIEVNILKLSGDQVYQRLTTGLAAGVESQLPDLVQVENQRIDLYMDNFQESFVNLSNMGFDEHRDKFVEGKISPLINDEGGVMAFPRDTGPMAVFYREDLFEEAGIDANDIVTWDDYIEAGEQMLERTGTLMTGIQLTGDTQFYRAMLQQQNLFYFDLDGGITANTYAALNSMETLKKMNDAGLFLYASNGEEVNAAIKNDAVASVISGSWQKGIIEDQMPEQEGLWRVMKLPAFEEGGLTAANDGGSNLAITSVSSNKEAAYLFGEFASVNVDNQVHGALSYGAYPALIEAIDRSELEEGDAFFGGQEVFTLFGEEAVDLPVVNFTDDYLRAQNTFNDAIGRVILQDVPIDEALETASNRLQAATGREVSDE